MNLGTLVLGVPSSGVDDLNVNCDKCLGPCLGCLLIVAFASNLMLCCGLSDRVRNMGSLLAPQWFAGIQGSFAWSRYPR